MTTRHWQASYGSIPKDINPDAVASVVELMEQAMQRFADKPAFRCAGQTLSYAQVDKLSRDFAAYLQNKLGVKKGDRIAVMTPNLLAFPIAFLGIVRAGAVQVNVNPLYTPRELEHQLNDAGVETIVVYSGVSGTVAEVHRQDAGQDRHHQWRGRRQRREHSEPARRCAADGRGQPGRCAGRRCQAAVHAGRAERRRPAVPAVHRRHHRPVQGRRAVAPQPGRQRRAVQGLHARCAAARSGSDRHRDSAVSHLRADGELHHLLLGRRRQLAGAEPARLRRLHRHDEEGASERLHGRQHACTPGWWRTRRARRSTGRT